ncbi:MAG: TolC family protein [Phycisphaeraceae bacterium]|nr:TolC family protein [Phycisphaeraceae bacterium]
MISVCLLLAGCAGLWDGSRWDDLAIAPDQLRRANTLDLQPAPESAPTTQPTTQPAEQLDLTIEQCRQAALAHNLDLRVDLINPAIAREGINEEEARFEALFRTDVGYSNRRSDQQSLTGGSETDVVSVTPGLELPLRTGGSVSLDVPMSRGELFGPAAPGAVDPYYSAGTAITLSQPLLRGAGFRANTHGLRLARYQSQIAQAETKLQVISVLAAVDRVYWRLYAARRELEVRRQQHDLAVRLLEKSQRLVAAGVSSDVEVIRSRTGVAESLEAIITSDNAVRDRQRELKRVLNRPDLPMPSTTTLVPASEPAALWYDLDESRLMDVALRSRMEMLRIELQLAQDASTQSYLRNAALPLVTVGYTYGLRGLGATPSDAWDLYFNKDYREHRVTLSVEVPLGNEAAQSRLRAATLTRLQRMLSKQQQELQVRQEVLSAVDQLHANWQRILVNRQRVVLAARSLDAEQRQFEQGLRTATDVLDAQTSLADAESSLNAALTEYEIAKVDLAFATGTVLGAAAVEWDPAGPDASAAPGRVTTLPSK